MSPSPEPITPVVLVGGRSRRFGRDKLQEPLGDGWLVDRPITALREVFGRVVMVVGDCDPAVAARADGHLADRYPGTGPAGGILAALESLGGSVLVLAGDLPRVTARTVRAVLDSAESNPRAVAAMARAAKPEPCVALYRAAAAGILQGCVESGRSIAEVFASLGVAYAPVAPDEIVNANTPDELRA